MPGLTFVFTPSQESDKALLQFKNAQSCMLHGSDYVPEVDFAGRGTILGHVGYAHYPVQVFTSDTKKIYMEGHIYGLCTTTLQSHLTKLSDQVFRPEGREGFVRDWICEHDGEYVVVILDTLQQQVAIVTDFLGRLPLYYHQSETSIFVARECKFILCLMQNPALDRLGCAEFLWMGYPLGDRTLFKDIKRAPGGMLMLCSAQQGRVRASALNLFQFNFDEEDSSSKSADQYAQDLVDAFTDGANRRAQSGGFAANVVSLSGGWDSRAVAAALKHAPSTCAAATYINAEGRGRKDALTAVKIAKVLQIPCEVIHLPPAQPVDEERLVLMKDGANYSAMAFILAFMDEIVAKWGRRSAYWTGDGGPKVLTRIGLRKRVYSADEAVEEIANQNCVLPAQVSESIMGLPGGALLEELGRIVSRYPETNLTARGIHFTVYERGARWNFDGEDRSRIFLWQVSPFYSVEFFRYGMRVPGHLKRDHHLYRRFLLKLCPEVGRIQDANTGLRPSSPLFPCASRLKSLLLKPHRLRRALKPLLLREDYGRASIAEHVNAYLENERSHHAAWESSSLMDHSAVEAMLVSANKTTFANWWTLALLERLLNIGAYSMGPSPREFRSQWLTE